MKSLRLLLVFSLALAAVDAEEVSEHYEEEQNLSTPQPATTIGGNFAGFDDFINGLTHLRSVLDNPSANLSVSLNNSGSVGPQPTEEQMEHVSERQTIGIGSLFNLVVKMKAISNDVQNAFKESMKNSTGTEAATSSEYLTQNSEHDSNTTNVLTSSTTSVPPQPDISQYISALNELSETLSIHANGSGPTATSVAMATSAAPQDGLQAVISILEELLQAHEDHRNSSISQPNTSVAPALSSEDNITGLLSIIEELGKLAAFPDLSTTTESTEAPTPPVTCEPPLQEIAYRMCILQVTDKRLNWFHARHYCRSLGGELAQDSVVIKTRRYLNDLYGEEGTRVRWPFWVGGYEVSDDEGWRWQWQDGGKVPDFLWSHKQPRFYSSDQTPRGTCMTLDGFQAFYGASLPCHLRRRFVCQMWK